MTGDSGRINKELECPHGTHILVQRLDQKRKITKYTTLSPFVSYSYRLKSLKTSLFFFFKISFLKKRFYLFIFGCAGSLLRCEFFSSWSDQGLLLLSTGCRAHGLQELQGVGSIVVAHGLSCSTQHVGSSWTRDQTCVFWTGRQILYHWATWEAPEDISVFQNFNTFTHFGPFRNKPFKGCTNQLPDDHHALCYTKKGIKYSSLYKWLTRQPGDGSQGVASVKRCALLQEKGQKTRARAPES